MGDGDGGRAQLLHLRLDQIVDDVAHDGVEAGGRLVEENDLGLGGDGAGEADALAHAAGKLGRHQVGHFRPQADLALFFHRHLARLLFCHAVALAGGRR